MILGPVNCRLPTSPEMGGLQGQDDLHDTCCLLQDYEAVIQDLVLILASNGNGSLGLC